MPEEYVGEIGFDSGMCWLGDPAYLSDGGGPMQDWPEFVEKLGDATEKSFRHPEREDKAEGLGVVLSGFGGDIGASVYVTKEDGLTKEARIVFGGKGMNRKVAAELLKIARELTARVTERDVERLVVNEGGSVSRILQFLANIKLEEANDWKRHYGTSKEAQAHFRVAQAIWNAAHEVDLIESRWKNIWEEQLEQESA